jgi:hypothetical protein
MFSHDGHKDDIPVSSLRAFCALCVRQLLLASFWRCYDELPGHVQRLARKNFELFKANPRHPSLGFQKKGGVYTVEVGRMLMSGA